MIQIVQGSREYRIQEIQETGVISNFPSTTSMCGISFRGLSAKYAYNALKTAYKNKEINKLILLQPQHEGRKEEHSSTNWYYVY